jgi:hypothetical protein
MPIDFSQDDMIFGMDWGSAAYAVLYVLARDPDGRVFVIAEVMRQLGDSEKLASSPPRGAGWVRHRDGGRRSE